jgi:Na+/melibiose symporter-like transporter
VTTTTKTMMSTGELAGLERTITAEPERGVARTLLSTVEYVVRQLAGSLAIIVLVWLVVMLFRHAQTVAFVLAGVVLALGGAALFVRNRSLSR